MIAVSSPARGSRRSQLRRRAASWGKAQHLRHHIDRWEAVLEEAAAAAARQVA